jgi:hypothetical protein
MTRCPSPSELLLYAVEPPNERVPHAAGVHVARCASCQGTVTDLREAASVLHSSDNDALETPDCLDEMTVAHVAEQGLNLATHSELVLHLASCVRCREQVASVSRVLRSSVVAAEIGHLATSRAAPSTRRWGVAGAGGAMAIAAALILMIASSGDRAGVPRQVASGSSPEAHREPSLATTAAPYLIAPTGKAAADTFRWSAVPHADRYRVKVFDRHGAVMWEAEASDTVIVPPLSIALPAGATFLWKVEARTGWDRWVASELVEFSVPLTWRTP